MRIYALEIGELCFNCMQKYALENKIMLKNCLCSNIYYKRYGTMCFW